jgi:hypothetical protein
MVMIGIDAHKRTHTIVAVDGQGRQLAQRTTGTTSTDHLELVAWAGGLSGERLWAVADAGTSRAGWSATCSRPGSASSGCRRS